MKNNANIRSRDKTSGLITVSVIFAICSFSILYTMLYDSNSNIFNYKDNVVIKTERQSSFRAVQTGVLNDCDSIFTRIERFDPGVNAIYEDNDIKFLINNIKLIYEKNMWDKRYKVFYHVGIFCDMWFADKKIAWSKKNNIVMLKKNLEECEIGLDKKNRKLNK